MKLTWMILWERAIEPSCSGVKSLVPLKGTNAGGGVMALGMMISADLVVYAWVKTVSNPLST